MPSCWAERSWAIHVDNPTTFKLFSASESNNVSQFRSIIGLSSSDSESRDVFDRALLSKASATTVGGSDEEISIMHYLACLSPVRTDIMILCAEADPSLLQRASSKTHETPAQYSVCCGNLPALDLLTRLSERLLKSRTAVLLPSITAGEFGPTVAHYAAAFDKVIILAWLRQFPEFLIRSDCNGLTPIHVAARCFSERSLLFLSKWFASPVSNISLREQLFLGDHRNNLSTLTLLARFWDQNSRYVVLFDLAKLILNQEKNQKRKTMQDDGLELEEAFWNANRMSKWYTRSQVWLPKCCFNKIWRSGRRIFVLFPVFVVMLASGLSFFGVFWWPQSYFVMFEGGSFLFLQWAISTAALVSTLVVLQIKSPGYVIHKDNPSLHDSFTRDVMDRPQDGRGVVEQTLMTGIGSGTTKKTLTSEHLCPFCEIRRPLSHHGLPTEHCFICGQCCAGQDHHCPWTGSCIGQQNIWIFRIFLIVTMTTVISYVRLYALSRRPRCKDGDSFTWCVLNGNVAHSILLIFFYLPLFLFAGAIGVNQLRYFLKKTTMVGIARDTDMKHKRTMKLCGGMS